MVSESGSERRVSSSTPTSALIYDAYTSIKKKSQRLLRQLPYWALRRLVLEKYS